MKRIAILGCENTHANGFLEIIKNNAKYSDVEVVGVYSADSTVSQKLHDTFGVNVMQSVDELVGKVDGIMVTVRNGKYHREYVTPYLNSGIPMFIDKPFAVSEDDAIELATLLKNNNIRISGGSSVVHDYGIQQLKKQHAEQIGGKTLGGFVKAPVECNSLHSGFFFYAQHLTESLCEIYGRYPNSVYATQNGDNITVIFYYDSFNVVGLFTEHNYKYYAGRISEESNTTYELLSTDEHPWFVPEFDRFYNLLCGGAQDEPYNDFVAPVFVMSAIYRSMQSGKKEDVNKFDI